MLVYFLRHASAGQSLNDPQKDEKRALDKEGIEQCGEMGRMLAAMEAHVDAVISSPLKRATQTASRVANEIAYEGKVHLEDALRPSASFSEFREMLERYSRNEAIMVVGHNPNFSDFLGRLISRGSQPAGVDLKKGAVARVEWDKRGVLHWCVTPKIVRAAGKGSK